MVEPRHAQESSAGFQHRPRKWLLVTLAVLVVAGLMTWLLWPDQQQGVSGPDSQHSVEPSSSGGHTATSTPSPAATPSDQSSADNSVAAAALTSCRAQIRSEEKIIDAARTGIGHWSAHVQSQTDRFDGRISESQMSAIWDRTKSAGPADVRRYSKLADQHPEHEEACQAVKEAPKDIARSLSTCQQRQEAIKPLLSASDKAMADWEHHLADMRRSASGHAHHAEQVWLDTWRKASKNIVAVQAADKKLADAPSCR